MAKMILAIDAYRLVSEAKTSGAFLVYELAMDLSKQTEINEIILLLPRKPDIGFNFPKIFSTNKIRVEISSEECYPEKNFLENIKWIQWTIPKLLKRIQATHLLSPYHQTPIMIKRAIIIITYIHDICGIKPSAGYSYFKKGPYKHWINFITALIRTDGYIYNSKYTKKVFESTFQMVKKKPNIVIYPKPTISESLSPAKTIEILRNVKVRYKDYFFAIGTPDYRKGSDITINAFQKYKNMGGEKDLVFLTPKVYKDEIINFFGKYSSSITIQSDLSIKERDALYAGAIALIFPSRCEGFGYPILEAMCQGCPPIALRDSPADEIIGDTVESLTSLNIDEIVDRMFFYESIQEEDQQKLNNHLQERANCFIAEIENGRKVIELIQNL